MHASTPHVDLDSRWRVWLVAGLLVVAAAVAGLASAEAAHATNAPGTISSNTTWTKAASPYVVSSTGTSVANGVALTIEPGVVVKFQGTSSRLSVHGALRAEGEDSEAGRIVFTSINDDGTRGAWSGIVVYSSASAVFDYVDIRSAGYKSGGVGTSLLSSKASNSAVYVHRGEATIDHARITDNMQNAIGVIGGGSVTVQNSLIARNYRGISIQDAKVEVDRSTIRDNDGQGMYFLLLDDDSAYDNYIHDSNITRNKSYGVYVYGGFTPPVASVPHGTRNNIYNNRLSNRATPTELWFSERYTFIDGSAVDWTENFWGEGFDWLTTSAACTAQGYGWVAAPGQPEPVNPGWYSSCRSDNVDTRNPSSTYIQNGAYDDYSDQTYYGAVLSEYAPFLRFDTESEYWNASAQTMTDWPENTLSFSTGPASQPCASFGTFDHVEGGLYPDWSIDTLVVPPATYPGTACYPSEADNVDANGDDKAAADSYRYGPLDNIAYARARVGSDGKLWLQYWLFYYNNTKSLATLGDHQGDWEMVQYRVQLNGVADRATYAQHDDEEADACPYDKVEEYQLIVGGTLAREGPVVYVASGSQASYFGKGTNPRGGHLPADTADGLGELRNVEPNLVNVSSPPAWVMWPGRWGDDDAAYLDGDSPRGPGHQGTKWDDPSAFDAQAGPCVNPDGTPR